ncbi:MAG TPA: hypothetical protein VLU25_18735 [Acidobacteriota bacterium]|nr:hypothetical protein [Acidobacteriota bacterium]
MSLPSYSTALLLVAGAMLVLAGLYLSRRLWQVEGGGLQSLPGNDPDYGEQIMPLMIYEERYPAFGRIAALVFGRFPLSRFLPDEDFRRALDYLSRQAFQEASSRSAEAAMCVIVKTFVSDPEVQYRCRPLDELVDQFLAEIEID